MLSDHDDDKYNHRPTVGSIFAWWLIAAMAFALIGFLAVELVVPALDSVRGNPEVIASCPTAQSEAIQATWEVDDPRPGC